MARPQTTGGIEVFREGGGERSRRNVRCLAGTSAGGGLSDLVERRRSYRAHPAGGDETSYRRARPPTVIDRNPPTVTRHEIANIPHDRAGSHGHRSRMLETVVIQIAHPNQDLVRSR
jgi:hypothetical protein